MSNSPSNTTGKRWTRIGPGLFQDRNGSIYQVKRKGPKLVWKRLEGINGNTKAAVIADPLPEGPIQYFAPPRVEPRLDASPVSREHPVALPPRSPAQAIPPPVASPTVAAVVAEMLESKRNRLGKNSLRDLSGRLKRFAKFYGDLPVSEVSGPLLQSYIDGIEGSWRTKDNNLSHVAALIRWAIKRNHLPKGADEVIEYVERPKDIAVESDDEDYGEDYGEAEIFTSSEMQELLAIASPELIPFLTIGGFAGIRVAEIKRLHWSHVDLEQSVITVPKRRAKKGRRRVVPILPNLKAWLGRHAQNEGKVFRYASEWNHYHAMVAKVNKARRAAGKPADFRWRKNGLRHSFCSYRLAVTADLARVAHEAGNSPRTIEDHYKALVTEKHALEWFNILPP